MVRVVMMPQMQLYEDQPGPELSNFTNPLMQGLQSYRQGMDKQFEGDRALAKEKLAQNADTRAAQSQEFEMQRAKVQQIAGIAQRADQEADPARKAAIMGYAYKLHPDLAQHLTANGMDINDHANVSKMLIAEARGFVDPLTEEAKRAQIEHTRMGTAASAAQLKQIRMQTPEARARLAAQYGITPNTPEYNSFVLNGTYTPKDDLLTTSEGQTISRKLRGPDGGVIGAEPLVHGTPKAPPEHISKTANFAARMIEAERNVRRMIDGVDPISGVASPKFAATDWNAGVANATMMPEIIGNQIRSSEHQLYRQGAQQWIRSFLRKESGAAISSDEFVQDFKTYFPQPGDSDDVVKQKQAARAAAMNGFVLEAGDYFTKQRPDLTQHLKLYSSTSPDTEIKKAPAPTVQPPPANTPPGPVRVRSPDEARRLPRGTPIILPDGSPGVVP